MQRNGVQMLGSSKDPDRKFKAYAQQDCLAVTSMFDAEITITDGNDRMNTVARFYVVKDGPQPLLGRKTAKELSVLQVGLPSQHEPNHRVEVIQRFPSIRDVKIHIPIDRSVETVAQPLR